MGRKIGAPQAKIATDRSRSNLYRELLAQGLSDEDICTVMDSTPKSLEWYFRRTVAHYNLYRPTREEVIRCILREKDNAR